MVHVIVVRNDAGQVVGFHADGHALAGAFGSDIVCSAISAVMITALNGLEEYMGLGERLTYTMDDDAWLYCKLPQDLTEVEQTKAQAIIETMILGLQVIELDNPDNIHVEEEVDSDD